MPSWADRGPARCIGQRRSQGTQHTGASYGARAKELTESAGPARRRYGLTMILIAPLLRSLKVSIACW